jgi:hypothetical protein
MGPLTLAEIEAGIGSIYGSPRDAGTLEMIVRRPDVDVREVVEEGELSLSDGLVGDNMETAQQGHARRLGSSGQADHARIHA